ncbi:CPBP family intramembrane glutamic endopeptidase [Xanthomonas axonopodis pv. vasculorum]|uniref:CPBP family intramembrane glutamic endopeptidase n=1 Tax=Xanthomonas axonopodis TaxID=53413 RepID=UPI002157BC1A|nr:CPBP family intramembrane glutamic endopeptidase [Xanthomonas axonopodis]
MQEHGGASAGWGELLLVVTIAFGLSIWFSVSALVRDAVEPVFSDASLWGMVLYELLLLAISLINPIFEEVFVCGYVIGALESRHGRAFAVNVSVAIRTSYHLYQGPIGAINILMLA